MAVTRREFVACAVAALAMPRERKDSRFVTLADHTPRCEVLDLGEQCRIRESIAGYRSVLAHASLRRALLVVPAALAIPTRPIERSLRRGATVILESGAGFAEADSQEFLAHRVTLRDRLRIHIEPPIVLWPRATPYVDYTWPTPATVRDFSRVVPLRRQEGRVIATVDDVPVALMRRVGRGTLIFLGSPLGPALWADDAEARRLLLDVVSSGSA